MTVLQTPGNECLFGLDPGKTTFGMSYFVNSRLWAMVTIHPDRIRQTYGHANGKPLKRYVSVDANGDPIKDCARFCASHASMWMRACFQQATSITCALISEYPRIYHDGKKNDRNDLMGLADCVSAIEQICHFPTSRVNPSAWKHNVDGDAWILRIKKHLLPEELPILKAFEARVKSKALQSHALDAVGLALWKLGRL